MGLLEKLRSRAQPARAALYARFSSDNQRNESIDAQERAIREFARNNNIILVASYIDRAKSAMTDDRPQFQQMIKEAAEHKFDIVLVHKLDRFARNRNDSIINRSKLKRNGVSLLSVTEPLDDEKPESIILEAVLEAMAEYYSKNLAREVRKGLNENALKATHTGGRPPLGYDVDNATRKLIINPQEAEAVRIIFKMVIEGHGYSSIMHCLNSRGYKTKTGSPFGKNSLYEILRNPKYKGVYVYNKAASADPYIHTRNTHQWKDKSEMIILAGAVPQIISEEDFETVQRILQQRRRHNHGAKHHKEVYLLTGKIFCGKCGCRYSGNRKRSAGNRAPNITYRCNNRARRTGIDCDNKEVNRDYLEDFVLKQIENAVFHKGIAEKLLGRFQEYMLAANKEKQSVLARLKKEAEAIARQESNITDILAGGTISDAQQRLLLKKLDELDSKHQNVLSLLEQQKAEMQVDMPTLAELKQCLRKAKELFRKRELEEQQALVNLYVEKIIVHANEVEVILNLVPFAYRRSFTRYQRRIDRKELRRSFYGE